MNNTDIALIAFAVIFCCLLPLVLRVIRRVK
jgi:hypothetical protein